MTESKPTGPETTQLDTSKIVSPKAKNDKETTPIFDETVAYLKDVPETDLTHFDEDDDPTQFAGDFVDEDGDGIDDRTQEKS